MSPCSPGRSPTTPEEARAAAERIGAASGGVTVVKAQVKTGGRGKAGGVKVAKTADEAEEHARAILGMDIKGHTVHQVMIAQGAADRRGVLLLDPARPRATAPTSPCARRRAAWTSSSSPSSAPRPWPASPSTPTSASTTPRRARSSRRPASTPTTAREDRAGAQDAVDRLPRRGRHAGRGQPAGARPPTARSSPSTARSPSTRTPSSGTPSTRPSRTHAETDPLEMAAKEKDLNYVKLDGSVGIIGNGAGLVMSTLDVVAYAGEEFGGQKPANFLDIGGGASAEVMANGLHIILRDPQVKSVFVNVFGGITACDAVANGIVGALDAPRRRGGPPARRPPRRQQRRGGPAHPRRAQPPPRHHRGHHGRRRPQGRRAGLQQLTPEREERHDTHGHLPHRRLQGHRPGHDRLRGHEAHPADAALRHRDRRRRQPAQGRHHRRVRGRRHRAGVRHRRRGDGGDRRRRQRHLRPGRLHQGRRDRGDRRRHPARRRHHRGRRRQGHRGVLQLRQGEGHDAHHRPELPRPDQPRGRPTPASSPPTSPAPAASAWSRSRAR